MYRRIPWVGCPQELVKKVQTGGLTILAEEELQNDDEEIGPVVCTFCNNEVILKRIRRKTWQQIIYVAEQRHLDSEDHKHNALLNKLAGGGGKLDAL